MHTCVHRYTQSMEENTKISNRGFRGGFYFLNIFYIVQFSPQSIILSKEEKLFLSHSLLKHSDCSQ